MKRHHMLAHHIPSSISTHNPSHTILYLVYQHHFPKSAGGVSLLFHIQFDFHVFFSCELHDKESIASLALTERGINAHDKQDVSVVWFGEKEEFDDLFVVDFVVVCFASETQKIGVHVDIVASSWSRE